ncbi:MAG: NADH-quinone oxidoreductase subunit NuoE [Rhodospirillaceae bacterium]|jgi:NADH-quinone oxidoreductase E subunit|nr:NADH-quinone oxidoreductase subunit NuoE [Rhodospirillaceae bacterium]|tara:strand:+ start:429 stop:1046 length:618 start_codon:yes stop_codon:yes gene_type:complete
MNAEVKDVNQPESFEFTTESMARALEFIAKYPEGRQQSALMPLLDIAQRQHDSWLPRAAMDYVADLLGVPRIEAYEVATFYTMYNLQPVGDNHVQVCTNLPCWLRGSDKIASACKKNLGVGFGETTEDGQFTLSEVECLGACANAPMIQINDDYYEDLDENSTESILSEIKLGKEPKTGSQIGRKSCEPATGLTSLTGDGNGEDA